MQRQKSEQERKRTIKRICQRVWNIPRSRTSNKRHHLRSNQPQILTWNWRQSTWLPQPNVNWHADSSSEPQRSTRLRGYQNIVSRKKQQKGCKWSPTGLLQSSWKSNSRTHPSRHHLRFERMPRHGALLFKSIWAIWCSRKGMGTEASRLEDMAKYQNLHFNRAGKRKQAE